MWRRVVDLRIAAANGSGASFLASEKFYAQEEIMILSVSHSLIRTWEKQDWAEN